MYSLPTETRSIVSGVAACACCAKDPNVIADMTIALQMPAFAIDFISFDFLMLSGCPSAFRFMCKMTITHLQNGNFRS
jgi:hypothetical protein